MSLKKLTVDANRALRSLKNDSSYGGPISPEDEAESSKGAAIS